VAVRDRIRELTHEKKRFYILPDYSEPEDGRTIAELFSDLPFHSGGSAFAADLFRVLQGKCSSTSRDTVLHETRQASKGLVLAGSCSKTTLRQIHYFKKCGGAALELEPSKLIDGAISLNEIETFIQEQSGNILVFSSQEPAKVRENQKLKGKQVSEVLEATMASLAKYAVNNGIRKLIVAGGETSGAAARALNCTTYAIGPSLAPGVPLLYPLDLPGVSIVLKSGNFGDEDFFVKALIAMTGLSVKEET
jgi:uncharacterized protein YgbK (DUF1537 family)